jgi:hypothetical protein
VTTNAGGTVAINTGTVTTTGAQTYNDAVTLGTDVALTTSGSNIAFANTVDSETATARSLKLNTGSSGSITFSGNVGSIKPLAALTITNASGVTFAGSLASTGLISINGLVSGGNITFQGNVDAGSIYTAISNYNLSFVGANNIVRSSIVFGKAFSKEFT